MAISILHRFEKLDQFQALQRLVQTLQRAGFEALIAGGAVRDALLGRPFHDIDVATSAHPDQVIALFEKTIAVGKSFGVVVVQVEGFSFEVASFRREGEYVDGRKPTQVEFTMCTPQEDALRRDFTVNALFYDLTKDEVRDYVGGLDDLKRRQIRAVGVPLVRFKEDHLRILRALRFKAQLGFTLEAETQKAIEDHLDLALTPSRERIASEVLKMILSVHPSPALEFLRNRGFFQKMGFQFDTSKVNLWKQDSYWQRSHGHERSAWLLFTFLMTADRDAILGVKEKLKLSNKVQVDALLLLRLRELTLVKLDEATKHRQLGEILEVILTAEEGMGLFVYSLFRDFESNEVVERLKIPLSKRFPMPAAILKAQHLKDRLFGAKLGQALRETYWRQIYEFYFEDRQMSLEELLKTVSNWE